MTNKKNNNTNNSTNDQDENQNNQNQNTNVENSEQNNIQKNSTTKNEKDTKFLDNINKQNIEKTKSIKSKVIKLNSSIAYLSYVNEVQIYNEVKNLRNQTIGFVKSVHNFEIEVYLIVENDDISIDEEVNVYLTQISIKFHDKILGSVINPLGDFIMSFTSREELTQSRSSEIFQEAPNIESRSKLNDQFVTGYNIVDFMFPVGYGQRMLVIGDKQTHKTEFFIETIKNIFVNRQSCNRDKETICIYVSIGQKKSDLSRFINDMIINKVSNTMIVAATSSDPLGLQYLAPYAATSIADFYAKNNYNIILIYDDLSKHAIAYRELCLLAHEKPGRQTYSSDIFYTHSSLLERSLKYKNGGSITSLIGIESFESEIDYITTNVISITDGQLFFSSDKLKLGLKPPICTSLSVSRTGASVQLKGYKGIMGIIRQKIALYNQSLDFYKNYKEECDKSVLNNIKWGLYIINLLYNTNNSGSNGMLKQLCIKSIIEQQLFFNNYSLEDIEQELFINQINVFISNTINEIEIEIKKNASIINDNQKLYDYIKQYVMNAHNKKI
ncbi:ATP synthase subunit alpha [bacterium AB1]|nr:ATP synthase subunit alpha [bacterium AB1]